MRSRIVWLAAGVVAACGLATAPTFAVPTGDSVPDRVPSSLPTYKYLRSVSALAPDDVWAVGQIWVDQGDRTLIQHFDGDHWTRFPSPNPGDYNDLYDVTAIAPDDVWAVGSVRTDGAERPFILHWDGTTWSEVRNEITDYADSGLYSVVGVGSSDVWAVGNRYAGPMIVHWDGSSWTQQQANDGGYDILEFDAISAISHSRLWLIGNGYFDEEQGPQGAIPEQWDGTQWTVEYGGGRPSWFKGVYYDDIAGSSPKDAWLGGSKSGSPFVLHWNGKRWTQPTDFPADHGFVGGIEDRASDDVWMVGGHDQHSAIWHYDGVEWTTSLSGPTGNLAAVDGRSAHDVWAVGVVGDYPGGRCLIEHWDGIRWTATRNCAGHEAAGPRGLA